MFDPSTFIDFAKELSQRNQEEAALRTAIGRAYQGTFLLLREWLKTRGYSFPVGKNSYQDHRKVQDCLYQELQIRSIKDKLSTLRQYRNKADYDIEESITFQDTEEAINLSDHLKQFVRL